MNSRAGWDALVERRPWLARAMLLVCSLSLLATSPDDDGGYGSAPFTKISRAPVCTLTAEAPLCDFLVTIRHDVPDPGQPFFTNGAQASIRGSISANAVTGEVPFVAVRLGSSTEPGADELNALTQFSLEQSLAFSGGCDAISADSACVSTFSISFRRTDAGTRGGTLDVSWELQMRAHAASGEGTSMGGTLPWTVEYTPQ